MMKTLAGPLFVRSNLIGGYYRSGLFAILLLLVSICIPGCPRPPIDPPPDKVQPNADAGNDRKVMVGQRVYLNALKNDMENISYTWSRTGGPEITFDNVNTTNTNFVAQAQGTYQVQLAVRIDDLEDTDSVTIVALPQSSDSVPIAKAGADRTAPPSVSVGLDGRASYDPAGGNLTYSWRQIEGSVVILSGADTAVPTFTTPAVTESTNLSFELYVQNAGGYDSVDTVTISVSPDAAMQYNLAIKVQGGGNVVPNQGAFNEGSQVQLAAAGNTGWRFDRWENDLTGTINPSSIIMNNNTFITAVFIREGYTLTLLTQGEGSVSTSPAGDTFESFTEVILTPTPANNLWKFDRWEGHLTESDNPGAITMDSDKTVTAYFVPTNQVSAPSFSPSSFTIFQNSVNVTIRTATPEAAIYYILDEEREPTQSDTLYTGPILVTGNITIRARAFREGFTPSNVITANYLTMEVPGGITIKADE